ncbi:MAG: DEAD/DEAH box helicase [Gemmatimonadetes bacterium]|nr:DEAD/DEAH box helicase [Gemmatimonadota bacterium]MBT7861300.1 DEAD/DEAH box helicase [Gemmatimonadota bacterium]
MAPKTKRAGRKQVHPESKALNLFLPAVRTWFKKTFDAPSPAQEVAWPVIRQGKSMLLLAPTGSGKTLATFLAVIDDLLRRAQDGALSDTIHVIYVTPLKALGNDIHRNLMEPLKGVRRASRGRLPELRVAVRSGDTPSSERQKMLRRPPHILITTPESLYLMLGSARMATHLQTARTVIVDEVHALCDNKRGVHLALSLERLNARAEAPLQRIGCSATLRPLEEISRFLVGCEGGKPRPVEIVDAGMRKDLDVRVVTPLPDFLEASQTALWNAAYELLLEEIAAHRTTLIFCNSRYKAERTWLRLTELNRDDSIRIGVHHGSMSKERRLEAEESLKAGELDALVATSSLELGIDIGSVDLVYQLESPKSVATALQRIGRAGHLLDATSKGRVLVFDRDQLMEAAAVCEAMIEGAVDAVHLPRGCLDVLAQQIAGMLTEGDRTLDEVYEVVARAWPFHDLARRDFEDVVAMLAGEQAFDMKDAPRPLILWDRPTGRLTGARSVRHVTSMCVGTIADTSEYEVVIARNKKRIGCIQSEFVDDMLRTDDVFVLGNSSWRVTGKQRNQVLVEEAPAATPTVPWWQGGWEPRSTEVGRRVGLLRRRIAARLDDPALTGDITGRYGVDEDAAEAMIQYVLEQRASVEEVPDHEALLVERWTDELGKLNLIIHCPLGQRLNQAWGEALTTALSQQLKETWSSTVNDDLLVLTRQQEDLLPLPGEVARKEGDPYEAARLVDLVSAVNAQTLIEAGVTRHEGGAAFRHAAVCSLQILRGYKGRRMPTWLQAYQAEELEQAARDRHDYPVFREVRRAFIDDDLNLPALQDLLKRMATGGVRVVHRTVESPSPFAHSLLVLDGYRNVEHQMGRDRRANLLRLHRRVLQEVLSEEQLAQLLDVRAIEELERRLLFKSEKSRARDADELAQALRDLGDLPASMAALAPMTAADPAELLTPLIQDHRVVAIRLPGVEGDEVRLVTADLWRTWHDATTRRVAGRLEVLIPQMKDGEIVAFEPMAASKVIAARWRQRQEPDQARQAVVERYLKRRGPVTLYELANHTGLSPGELERTLDGLVAQKKAARGVYRADKPRPQWVDRTNLAEIHRRTMQYLKRELSACAPHEVMDFMLRWQHVHPSTRLRGIDGLRKVIAQLQGYEIIQGVLEPEVLAARVADYRPQMLERLIASGEVSWRRLHPSKIHRVAITLCQRRDMPWLAAGREVELDGAESADVDIAEQIVQVRKHMQGRGTAFFDDIVGDTGLDADTVERAVWHLAWCGELACDTYEALRNADFRSTLSACYDLATTPRNIVDHEFGSLGWDMTTAKVVRRIRKLGLDPRLGRWSVTERLDNSAQAPDRQEVIGKWAAQLLGRWGVVSRQMVGGEVAAPSWGELMPELKRLELLGQVQRGDFIEQHRGEQFGLPEAVELLRECRGRRPEGDRIGWLPDEPVIQLISRDPADLYAAHLDILREDGEIFERRQRAGNACHRSLVQAGQVILYKSQQNVTLERDALRHCFEVLMEDPAGRQQTLSYKQWNGYPVKVSPAASVMMEAGFALSTKGHMEYPVPRRHRLDPEGPVITELRSVLQPCHSEPPPVQYGKDWTISLVDEARRPLVAALLERLAKAAQDHGWTCDWQADGFSARYGRAGMGLGLAKRWIQIAFNAPAVRDTGGPLWRMAPWAGHRIRVTGLDEVNADFDEHLAELLDEAERRVDDGATR